MSRFRNQQPLSKTARNTVNGDFDHSDVFDAYSQQLGSSHYQSDKKHTKRNKSLLGKSRKEFADPQEYQQQLLKTTNQLFTNNFNHHDPNLCVCDSCNCGRHFCKLHNVRPDLTKSSIYKQSYPKKNRIPNIVGKACEYQKLKGDHIGMNSSYNKNFLGEKGDPNERPKPEDLLKSGGPSPQLTSYSSGFPGFKGANQYIKPTDQHVRADFPLRAKSTYTKSFQNKLTTKPITQKIPDNLKTSKLWMGKTTYGSFFAQPNPEDYAIKVKNVQKLEDNPNFNHQYQTTYKNSFLPNKATVCPAKVLLETKGKGAFNSSKDRFTENSDFKAMNPSFHSISTSKHCYV